MRVRASLLSVAVFVLFACWGLISPVGSSPDDDYHLASIWCAGGLVEDFCEQSPNDPDELLVPEELAAGHACYAFRPERNASCADDLTSSPVSVNHVNQKKGLYPGVFYGVMGLFAGSDVDFSVLVMRVVNSALAALLLFGSLVLAPKGIARALATATLIVYVPLGLFLIPSTNPSSWALTGVSTFWACGVSLLLRTSWHSGRTWFLAGGVVVGGILAAGARLDAAVYLSIVTVVAFVAVGVRQVRANVAGALLMAFMALWGLVIYWTTQPTVTQGRGPTSADDPGPLLFLDNAVDVPRYMWESFSGPLGWLDTAIPAFMPTFGLMLLGAVAYRQLSQGASRVLLASTFALVAYLAVPVVFLQLSGLQVGELIQARYLLPILFVLVATASLAPRMRRPFPWPRLAALLVVTVLGVGAGVAFWSNARRYATSGNGSVFDPRTEIVWTGLIPGSWWIVVSVGLVATAVVFTVGYSFLIRERTGSPRVAFRPAT